MNSFLTLVFLAATALVAHQINHSVLWTVFDVIFAAFAWFKWIICHQVNLSVLHSAFAWFLK